MKKKRNRISRYGKVILVLLLAGLSLVGYLIFIRSKVHTKGEISLALAARQTALVLAEKDDIQAADQSQFSVEERDSWYVPVSYTHLKTNITQYDFATLMQMMRDGAVSYTHLDVYKRQVCILPVE